MSTADKVLAALQPYQVKPDGKDRYRCNSPLRPGSNSHAFSITIDDAEHGAYHDFVSGDSGSLYDLAKLLQIDLPERIAVATTKRGYTGLDDYAMAHGVNSVVFLSAQWRETMKDNRLALEIPTRTGKRLRFLDGEKPTYKSPAGYERCWYGLTAKTMQRVASGQPLVICNGEASTVVGQYYGLAACAVTGGEHTIPPDLIDELKTALNNGFSQIYIALDCDKKGQETARKLCAQLKAHGFDVRAVDLGLGYGGDLADFCSIHAHLSGEQLPKLALLKGEPDQNSPHPHWRIIHANDLKHLPKVSWLINPEIPERGLTTIFGPSGVGKSFLALDYALRIAQEKPVVYIAAEGESGYLLRVSAWTNHYKRAEGRLHFCLGSPNVMDDEDLSLFIGEIAALNPVMVVVDTLAMAMIGGDENSSRDMGLVIKASLTMKRELECAVVLVHHTNKGGVIERGSGSLRGASDTMIKVTADDDLIVIESSKTKDSEPFPTRYSKLIPVLTEYGESRVLVETEHIQASENDPLTRNQRAILEAMALEVFRGGATVTDLEEVTNIHRGGLQRTLSRLLSLNLIMQPAKREPYVITQLGLNRINDSVDSVDSVSQPRAEAAVRQTSESSESSESTESLSRTLFPLDSVDSPRHQYAGGL